MTIFSEYRTARPKLVELPRLLLPFVFFSFSSTSAYAEETDTSGAQDDTADASTDGNEVVITDKARSHFRAGVNLLQDPDGARYEEAYQQFKAAYAESPSWKILSNLGIAAMKLERDGEAIDAFRGYLEGGGDEISEAEREQTQRDLETLEASIVSISITASPEGVMIQDARTTNRGDRVINNYSVTDGKLDVRLRPGNHKITAKLKGYEDATWEFNAPAASSHEHSFLLEKPKDTGGTGGPSGAADAGATHRPVPVGVWIGAGVTGALLAGSVGTGIVALGKNTEYDDANQEGDPGRDDLRNQVKTFNLVTDILIGGAVVGGVVTTVLYVTRPSVPRKSALHLEPILSPQVAALGLSGKF